MQARRGSWHFFFLLLLLTAFGPAMGRAQAGGATYTIKTEPGATVWVNGVKYGTTNSDGEIIMRAVPAGKRLVRVRADGFREVEKPIAFTSSPAAIPLVKTTDPAELKFQDAERQTTLDRKKAIAAYRDVIKLKPSYLAAHIGLARMLSESGEFDGALSAIKNLRKISPANSEASAIEGRTYKDSGDDEKAIASFKRAIAEGKGYQPEALTGLGLLYKERAETAAGTDTQTEAADYELAARYFRDAVKQLGGAPDAVIVYQLLGLVYERQQKYADAIALYNEFIARFPDSNEVPTVRSFIDQLKKQMAQQ